MQDESENMAEKTEPGQDARPVDTGAERPLIASLRLAIIPVVMLVLAALGAFAYGIAVFIYSVRSIAGHPFPVGSHIGLFLLDIDLFLIGATLLISAIGFYELFIKEIRRGEASMMPAWLEMHDLNDLKNRVIAMIVLVLSVSFAEEALDSSNGLQVLELGGGFALVIIALTVFLRLAGHSNDKN
jgi:uncharacterized membrane protein YqhA